MLQPRDVLGLVVGGGSVGRRKARALLDGGISVRIVCPDAITPPDGATWIREPYRSEHLDGVRFAVAAATPEVNAQVIADARSRAIWVNAANEPDRGDFLLPSVIRRGELTIAISTGGAAPSLARRIRERLEAEFDAAVGDWIALLEEIRPEVLQRIESSEQRRQIFERLTEWRWLDQLRREGIESARAAIRAEVDSVIGAV